MLKDDGAIINKKTNVGIIPHPLQHFYKFFISKVMAKKRRENDIRFTALKIHISVI